LSKADSPGNLTPISGNSLDTATSLVVLSKPTPLTPQGPGFGGLRNEHDKCCA
jgi:hypothetical protein